jgi:Tol biopolymer transport system component
VRLPVSVGTRGFTRYSHDGASLYTVYTYAESERSEIQKVDIRTGRTAKWLAIAGFTAVVGLAISQDESRLVISGRYQQATGVVCGVFEIERERNDAPRLLFREEGCDLIRSWNNPSFSPDGNRVVAWKGSSGVVDLIDLDTGGFKVIGRGAQSTWSPDGKWIAVVGWERSHVLLLDPNDPSRTRDLGSTDGLTLTWSPDSQYLLLWNAELRCMSFGYWGSLELADIQSGQRTVIQSSRCKVNNSTGGWVSNSVWK